MFLKPHSAAASAFTWLSETFTYFVYPNSEGFGFSVRYDPFLFNKIGFHVEQREFNEFLLKIMIMLLFSYHPFSRLWLSVIIQTLLYVLDISQTLKWKPWTCQRSCKRVNFISDDLLSLSPQQTHWTYFNVLKSPSTSAGPKIPARICMVMHLTAAVKSNCSRPTLQWQRADTVSLKPQYSHIYAPCWDTRTMSASNLVGHSKGARTFCRGWCLWPRWGSFVVAQSALNSSDQQKCKCLHCETGLRGNKGIYQGIVL